MEANWEPHLQGMLRYAAATTCRRSLLCRHFGEAPPPCHGFCDSCRAAQQQQGQQRGRAAGAGAAAAAAVAAGPSTGAAAVQQKDVTEAAKGAVQTLQVRRLVMRCSNVLWQGPCSCSLET